MQDMYMYVLAVCAVIMIGVTVYGFYRDRKNRQQCIANVNKLINDINRQNEFRYKMDVYQTNAMDQLEKDVDALKPVHVKKTDMQQEVRTIILQADRLQANRDITAPVIQYA